MTTITLRPALPESDFALLAELFTLVQDGQTTEADLHEDYRSGRERIFSLQIAEDARGERMGFSWASRSRNHPERGYFYVIVRPDYRGRGAGSCLLEDVERAARDSGLARIGAEVRDSEPGWVGFARKRGYAERSHRIGMTLDLSNFDERPYNALVEALKAQGYRFTTMHELDNTEAAQRRLYALNDTAAAETPGADGEHPWASFEDFQKGVCQSDWYIPEAQFIVINNTTGDWASMSAITRFQGTDYAYNLFTGTDSRYRGRKLAQAVKGLALQYARANLAVREVRTHHMAVNAPMIAIDRKMGYVQTAGYMWMEKDL